MKDTILRLLILHAAVLVLTAGGSALVWGWVGVFSALAGAASFSLPVVLFSGLVLQASRNEVGRFWGRFLAAELFKWLSSAVLLALAFASGLFLPQALLAGFLLSVLVQVFFPIFVRKASES